MKHISGLVTLVYGETRSVLTEFLTEVVRQTDTYTDHVRRKTVTVMDVVYVIKH